MTEKEAKKELNAKVLKLTKEHKGGPVPYKLLKPLIDGFLKKFPPNRQDRPKPPPGWKDE